MACLKTQRMHQKHSLEEDQRQLISFVWVDDSQNEKQSRIKSVAVKRDGRLLSPGKGIKITSVVAEAEIRIGPKHTRGGRSAKGASRRWQSRTRVSKVARLGGRTKKQAEHWSVSPSQRESER